MEDEWKQLFSENTITRVEYEEDSSDYFSSDDEANDTTVSHSYSPQNQIKGLSKFYQGKSQSFRSFSDITSVNDLAKKMIDLVFWKGNTSGRSFAKGSYDNEIQKSYNEPIQLDKSIRSSCASSTARTSNKPPIAMRKKI